MFASSSHLSSPKPSIRKFQASCGRGRYKKLLLRLEALAPLECSSESTTPRPSRAPCLAAPQKCHRRRKRDATSSALGSFLLRGKQAYAGLQITPFSDFGFSSSQPFRMLGQGEDTEVAHRKQALLGCKTNLTPHWHAWRDGTGGMGEHLQERSHIVVTRDHRSQIDFLLYKSVSHLRIVLWLFHLAP